MNNIPDFVMQIQEVERQLQSQCDITSEDWNDSTQDRYYKDFIDKYFTTIRNYIDGGGRISGKGLNDLLIFIDEKLQEMEKITGIPANVSFEFASRGSLGKEIINNFGRPIKVAQNTAVLLRDGIVHNDRRERDYWDNNDTDGSRPGEYTPNEIKQIMEFREEGDNY